MSAKKTNQSQAIINRSQNDPLWFLRRVLGCQYLTPQQIEVIESVKLNRRTAVTAGNSVGKTWLSARLALWFLYSFPRSKVISTAPTWNQVINLLWRELRQAHAQAKFPLGGEVFKTQINLAEDWFAIGFSTNEATNFQGFHAPRVMVIFDEATGIDPTIWDAAEGVAVGDNDRFLAIGNPTDPTSEFKRKDDSGLWNVIRLNAEEHPNVSENKMLVPGAVTRAWIAERLEEYGDRESPLYRARVRGLWPEQGDDVLITLALVEAAQQRWAKPEKLTAIGCDIARFGSDETIIIGIGEKGEVTIEGVRRGQDLMATAGQLTRYKGLKIGVDDAGLGGGVTDRLKEQGVIVAPVLVGSAAREDGKFVNHRTEIYWALRESLKAGDLSLPDDRKLAADLTNHKFSYDSRGRIKLESKDDLKKRLGRSPDRADALAIANWVRVFRGHFEQGKWRR